MEAARRLDPLTHAFCRVDHDEALEVAAELDQRVAQGAAMPGPLAGVPTAMKDLHSERGKPLCSSSAAIKHPVMDADSPAIRALRDAGLVSIGATVSAEFGVSAVTESPLHGVAINPWNAERISGGSSGGAAVAVASGILTVAHGSDGAGSIREPASYCGLVGMKASRGRVPSNGVGWASEGVLTRTVEDTAAALDALAAAELPHWYRPPERSRSFLEAARTDPPPLRVAVSTMPALPVEVDPEASRVVEAVADLLADLGHDLVRRDIPGLDPARLQEPFETYWSCISAGYTIEDEDSLDPLNAYLRQRALQTDTLAYVSALDSLVAQSIPMYALWRDVDVVLTPTSAIPAPRVGEVGTAPGEDPIKGLHRVEALAAMTFPANLLGLPAISIPVIDAVPTPLGAQLIGGPQRDDVVLSLAGQLERARPWRGRVPMI
ncbi:amidase [Jiangella muralis]|uniref:amidase n=1 Tax=Jiangella muralis TaxID=702383 RepID=UPI0014705723|nr:amidase [Jiangella muralis]